MSLNNIGYLWAEKLADRLDPPPSPYVGEPVLWTNQRVQEHVTQDMSAVMQSVVDNRYTAVSSCHDVGKSHSASRLVGWWLDSHPMGEAFAVTTAPTAAQVGAILWREIGRMHRKAELNGRITGDNEWKIQWDRSGPGELVAIGRKPADYDPAAFSGIHARYVLIVIDEACGVPKAIFEAVDSLATNEHARVLAIGNPDDPASYFAEVCKPGSGWNVIRVDALRSPGMTAQRIEKLPVLREYMEKEGIAPTTERIPDDLYDMLVSPTWVEERIKRWGIDSPIFQSKVRGRFPTVSIDTLIHPHWVTLAQARELDPSPSTSLSRMGVDVARYGVDHTIILMRRGGHVRVAVDIPYGPVTQTAGEVQRVGAELADSLGGVMLPVACVDDSGVGGGVVDILEENGYPVVPIVAGAGSTQLLRNGKPRFVNRRSELLWNLREALSGPSGTGEDGWLDLDPLDDEMAAQLTAIKYRVNQYGQIAVESKDEMKARGLPSPDRADSLSYSVAPDAPRIEATPAPQNMITGDLMGLRW